MPFEAGKGEHNSYIIPRKDKDQGPIVPQQDYLGIYASAWFVNKESSWFADRMASGTLDTKLLNGTEHHQVALGTFELAEGAKQAPVFNKPALPDRYFLGGLRFQIAHHKYRHGDIVRPWSYLRLHYNQAIRTDSPPMKRTGRHGMSVRCSSWLRSWFLADDKGGYLLSSKSGNRTLRRSVDLLMGHDEIMLRNSIVTFN